MKERASLLATTVTDLMWGWRGISGVVARRIVLRRIIGDTIEPTAIIHASIMAKSSIRVGKRSYVGFECNLCNLDIGKNVLISDGVFVLPGTRQHVKSGDGEWEVGISDKVIIGDGTWLGAGGIDMASIGAGSVISKPVPDGATVRGSPARVVG